jgi:hypothetical protein
MLLGGALLCVLLQGCGFGSFTSGLGGGMFGGKSTAGSGKTGVNEEQLLVAAKSESTGSTGADSNFGCPKFIIWQRDRNLTVYEAGRAGDGLAIVHQGEITQTARECQVEPGRVTVKYGFSGRVLLGPKGKAGNVTMPVAVFVSDTKHQRIAGDKLKVDVSVAPEQPIGYFSAVRTMSFALPEGTRPADFEVYVGFEKTPGG